jgi:hypothetical protein
MGGLEERTGGLEERMGGLEERIAENHKEMRAGFADVNTRLDTLEETVVGMAKAQDTYLEGDTLGTKHITLIRPEYDTMTGALHIENRFANSTPSAR